MLELKAAKLPWLILNVYGPVSLCINLVLCCERGGDLGAAYVNKIKFKSLSAFLKCECLTPVTLGRRRSALGEAVSCVEI